jgi:FMN phosphatase YigB (HAD superfamily)
MKLTVLLDLDDTLLENDIYKFLPHYLKALGKHLADHVAPDRMAKELLAATDAMIANNRSDQTLEEAFDASFYPAIGVPKSRLIAPLTDFYEYIFPELKILTSSKPAAVRLVEYAFQHGHTVAVATNPLFPARAIQHRLAWANLPVERYPFSLVTSFESFHYAKPNPAFIAECVARLGWPAQPVVMIGNSLTEDLLPAAKLGIPGFLVTSSVPPVSIENLPAGSQQGSLEDALVWLQDVASFFPSPEYTSPSAILAILRTTPAVLSSIGKGIPADLWNASPNQGEWCFTEIICHLRDADLEINISRLERILHEEFAFVAAVNADAWSATRSYCSEHGEEALHGFDGVRNILVQRLESLTEAQWDVPANHAIFGPTTLRELAAFIAQHDRIHIQQALQTLHLNNKVS